MGYFNRYAYVMNDPVNAIDPTGMVVEITGTDENRQAFIDIVSEASGLSLTEVDGKLTATNVDRDNLSVTGKSVLNAIESNATIGLNVTRDRGAFVFDTFERGGSGPVDVQDFQIIADSQDPQFTEALVTHLFVERTVSAERGVGYGAAHAEALRAEASIFGADNRTASKRGNQTTFTYVKGGFYGIGPKKVKQFSYKSDRYGNPK